MEPLEDLDKDSVDKEQEQVETEAPKSTLRKVTTLSRFNKTMFKVLGVVILLSVAYMYLQSKDIKIQQLESANNQSSNVRITSDIKDKQNDNLLVPEGHVEASKEAIRKNRENILNSQGESKVDQTAKVGAIDVFGGFFDQATGNSEVGKSVGGQSFELNQDFMNFTDNSVSVKAEAAPGQYQKPSSVKTPKNDRNPASSEYGNRNSNKSNTEQKQVNLHKGVPDLIGIRQASVSTIVASQKERTTPLSLGGATRASQPENGNSNSLASGSTYSNPSNQRYVNPLLTANQTTSDNRSKYSTGTNTSQNNLLASNSTGSANEGRSTNTDQINTQLGQSTSQVNYQTNNGLGRGLFIGEKMIGEFQHGISSISPTSMAIVKISQGPLAGARIVFRPTLAYDTFTYTSSVIQYKNYQAPFKAVLVTPDANLQTSYRSGVDYHTIYNLGMVFTVGTFKGAAEFINNVADEIVVSDNQIVTSVEFSPIKLLFSALGGVADAATPLLEKQLNKEPTVWVNANDLVGIMMVENWNAEWAPNINDNSVGIY